MAENDPQTPLDPNLPPPQGPDDISMRKTPHYTDVLGNPLEGEELERAKKTSAIGRPVSKGDPTLQKDDAGK